MDEGWIVIARKANEHPCLQAFDARGVWEKLLLMAAFRPHRVRLAGQMINLERGQLAVSLSAFAKSGGISRQRMRSIMSIFVTEGMTKTNQARGHACTVITVCNYDVYQNMPDDNGQADNQATTKLQPTERTKEQGNKRKKDSPSGESPSPAGADDRFFEALWTTYPRRDEDDKRGCHRLWKTAIRTSDAEAVQAAARQWCAEQSANPYRIGLRRWLRDKHYLHPPPVYRPGSGEHEDPIEESHRQYVEITRKMNGHGYEEFIGTHRDMSARPPPDIWDYPEDDAGADDMADSSIRRSLAGPVAGRA